MWHPSASAATGTGNHQQHCAQDAYDGGPHGPVERSGAIDSTNASQGGNPTADGKQRPKPSRQEVGAGGGNDQIRKHQKHAADVDERGDHEAEQGVKDKIPGAKGKLLRLRARGVEGDGEEFFAEDEMNGANGYVERERLE